MLRTPIEKGPSSGETILVAPIDPSADASFRHQMGNISRQSSFFFIGTIFTAGTGYLFKVYLARVLGAKALGIYALGMTIIGFVGLFNAFGLPQSAVRFVAAYRATGRTEQLRHFLGRGLFLLLFSNLILGGLLLLAGPWIAIHFYRTPELKEYFGLFVLLMLLGALTTFLGQVLAGYKDVARRTVITNFIGTPLAMVLSIVLIVWGLGLRGYILAQILGGVAVLVLLGLAVRTLTPATRDIRLPIFSPLEKQVVSFSAFALGVSLLEFLMAQSDKVLIGFYLNARDVGIYAVAMGLVSFVSIVLQSVNQIFSPAIADLHARGDLALLTRLFQTLTKWCLGLTLPLGAVMIIFAPVLMHVFGRDFEVGWPVLVIGTIGQVVNCGVGSVGYLLLMSGHQRDLVRIQTVMAVVMVALGLLLVPKWGIVGAAIVAAVTNLVSNLWYLWEVRRKLGMSPYNMSYFRLLVPLAGTLLVLLIERRFLSGPHSDLVLIATALMAGYVAFTGIALLAGLDPDDRLILGAIWLRTGGRLNFPGGKA
jgi:O-antigen/teichoic acid export membrane protein